MTNGVVYIVYGNQARIEAEQSIASLLRFNDLPITIISDDFGMTPEQNSRLAKVNLPQLVEYDKVLYLDADTRIKGNLSALFEILDDWDLALAPSKNQDNDLFRHIKNVVEKEETLRELGNWRPLQFQCGVMAFSRERCKQLFEEWQRQWQRWKGQDQAALLRALAIEPVRVWLLGKDWNSENGAIIQHLFGRI